MTPHTLTTAADYNAAPLGTVVMDSCGYAWQKVEKHTRLAEGSKSVWFGTNQDPLVRQPPQIDKDMEELGPHTVVYTPAQTDPVVTPNYEYSTPAELHLLDLLPDGYTVQDNDGRTWERTGGFWQSGLTGADNLSRKHTPYTIIKAPETPEPNEEPQCEYTAADLEELKNAPIGTIVKDKEGDEWVKARNGWAFETDRNITLCAAYAPYTVVHTPPSNLANL